MTDLRVPLPAFLFDDNPAERDLLGLAPTATTIARILVDRKPDPLTIGINSPWGGGKSTTLRLVEHELSSIDDLIVVLVDPWEFVDSGDPRGTLITRVLDGIESAVHERAKAVLVEGDARDKALAKAKELAGRLNDLRRRISWSKVAQVAIKSAITMTPDFPGLVDALTPKEQVAALDVKKGMRDFRDDFSSLLKDLPQVTRVVVLVDDLDRCLPEDVLGAFEAIKLFLSVKGMAFVLAADEQFIRESLREALNRHGRGKFANRYTEKVIQLPFTLPRLSKPDALAYIATLLVEAESGADVAEGVAAAAAQRRAAGNAPYAFADMVDGLPSTEQIRRASAIVRGMAPTQIETPRQIKRFLNNYAVRAAVLSSLVRDIPEELLMKLWILEQNHAARFAELTSMSEGERQALLRSWEDPDAQDDDGVGEWSRDGLLASENVAAVNAYISFAATVLTDMVVGSSLDREQASQLSDLLNESEVVRRAAQATVASAPQVGDAALVEHVVGAITGPQSGAALDTISRLAITREDLLEPMSTALRKDHVIRSLDAEHVPWLSAFPEVLHDLQELRAGNAELVEVIRDELAGTKL